MNIFQQLPALKVVPVIEIVDSGQAIDLAFALQNGGLPVAEITFRTSAAAAAIRIMRDTNPKILIGAGTLLMPDDLKRAVDAGAQFGVAPGCNPKMITAALELNFPFCPGIMTPSDIEMALSFGLQMVKFFPAEQAGGVAMLKNLIGPYKHTGIQFMPTGGITPEKVSNYLALPEVLAVGGSWIATRNDIAAGNWNQIRENCQRVANLNIMQK